MAVITVLVNVRMDKDTLWRMNVVVALLKIMPMGSMVIVIVDVRVYVRLDRQGRMLVGMGTGTRVLMVSFDAVCVVMSGPMGVCLRVLVRMVSLSCVPAKKQVKT